MQITNAIHQHRPEYGFILVRIIGGLLFFGSLFLFVQTAVSQVPAASHAVLLSHVN